MPSEAEGGGRNRTTPTPRRKGTRSRIPGEPLVTTELGKQKINFSIDIGATYSVLNTNQGKLGQKPVNVDATRRAEK